VARLGGEEFALLLPNTELSATILVCESLRETIKENTVKTDEGAINYTASFGLAKVTDEQSSSAQLLIAADKCLYQAKEAGQDKVVWPQYDEKMNNMLATKRIAV